MNVGVWIPCYRRWVRRSAVRTMATGAESLGFRSLWVQDHLVCPVGDADEQPVDLLPSWLEPDDYGNQRFSAIEYYGEENWWLDPYILWAFLAAVTESCELGSNVVVLPYRPAIVQAKMLGTLDVLSEGRMLFGIGVGHVPGEFEALGVPYKDRGRLTDEYLDVIAALLSEEETSFSGPTVNFPVVRGLVQPPQRPHPPFLIGGTSKRSVRRALERGDGWLPAHLSPESLRPGLDYMAEYASEAGRDPVPVSVVVSWGLEDPEGPPRKGGRRELWSVDRTAETIAAFADMGVARLAVDVPNPNLAVTMRQFELLARAVTKAGIHRG